MNYVKEIAELEAKLKIVDSKISYLESEKRNYEISYYSASRRSTFATAAMFSNLPLGHAVKISADGSKRRAINSIDDIKEEIEEYEKEKDLLTDQLKKLKEEQLATVKEAKLVVKGDSIYIDGDTSKIDLLTSVKEHRSQELEKIKKYEENQVLIEYQTLTKEQERLLKEYALPKDIMYKLQYQVYNGGSFGWNISYLNGVQIPRTESFANDALRKIEEKIEELNSEIKGYDKQVAEVKPTLMEKLFLKKKFEERLESLKTSIEKKKQDTHLEIDELKELYKSMKHVEETIIKPFFEKKEDRILYRLDYIKENYSITHMLSQLESARTKVADCNCYPYEERDILHMIPKEAKEYLDENNLNISIDTFIKKVMESKNIPEEIKKEIFNIFPKMSNEYKQAAKKSSKNIR